MIYLSCLFILAGASQAVMCFESPDPGNCDERITAFYYDPSRRLCQPFIYSGCGGNNNRFNSEEQCQRQCGDFKDQGTYSSAFF